MKKNLPSIEERLQHKIDTGTKFCSGCTTKKSLRDFYIRIRTRKPHNFQYIAVRETCKSCHKRNTVERRRRAPNGSTFGRYRKNAQSKGLEFSITREFMDAEFRKSCHYCGNDDLLITLDRVDNDIGYVETNCVAACIRCNLLKADMPISTWRLLVPTIRQIYESGGFGNWVPRNLRVNAKQDFSR